MTRDDLLELMGLVEDDLIVRAAAARRTRRHTVRWMAGGLAACLVLAALAPLAPPAGQAGTESGAAAAGAAAEGSAPAVPPAPDTVDWAQGAVLPLATPDNKAVDMVRALTLTLGADSAQVIDQYTLTNTGAQAAEITLTYPYWGTLADVPPVVTVDGTPVSADWRAVQPFDGLDPVVTVYTVGGADAPDAAVAVTGEGHVVGYGFASWSQDTDGTQRFAGNGVDRGAPAVLVLSGQPAVALAPDGGAAQLTAASMRLSACLRAYLPDLIGQSDVDDLRMGLLLQAVQQAGAEPFLEGRVRAVWQAVRQMALTHTLTLAPGAVCVVAYAYEKPASYARGETPGTGYTIQTGAAGGTLTLIPAAGQTVLCSEAGLAGTGAAQQAALAPDLVYRVTVSA